MIEKLFLFSKFLHLLIIFEFYIYLTISRICKFDLFWNYCDKISNDNIFDELYIFWKQILHKQLIVLFLFYITKKVMKLCCVRTFYNRCFLNVWFIFYFSIIYYEIHAKLIHVNIHWIETMIYYIIYNEIFVRKFLIYVCIFKFCQNICNDFIFCNLLFCAHVWI